LIDEKIWLVYALKKHVVQATGNTYRTILFFVRRRRVSPRVLELQLHFVDNTKENSIPKSCCTTIQLETTIIK